MNNVFPAGAAWPPYVYDFANAWEPWEPMEFGTPNYWPPEPAEYDADHLTRWGGWGIDYTQTTDPDGTQTSTTKVSLAAVCVLGALAAYVVVKHPDAATTCLKAAAPAALLGITLKLAA
jgi:hypothetical protein